jgi:hypothetical protein
MTKRDAIETLGEILPNAWAPRDAVHVAVIPMRAGSLLRPGQHVGVFKGEAWAADGEPGQPAAIGVVSPFLIQDVLKGQCFWLMIYPGTITSLRHQWEHPAFPGHHEASPEERAESEAWLREFFGTKYDEARTPAYPEEIEKILRGETPCVYGRGEHRAPSEFWFHLERLTGHREVDPEDFFFVCAC